MNLLRVLGLIVWTGVVGTVAARAGYLDGEHAACRTLPFTVLHRNHEPWFHVMVEAGDYYLATTPTAGERKLLFRSFEADGQDWEMSLPETWKKP